MADPQEVERRQYDRRALFGLESLLVLVRGSAALARTRRRGIALALGRRPVRVRRPRIARPNERRRLVPLDRTLAYAVFTVWVSICAFAPEVIWQGLVLLRGHFGPAQAYSALLVGALLAFFVEPLVERLKARQWRLSHWDEKGLLLTALVSLAFGVAAVCIHEAIAAYFGGGHTGEEERWTSLTRALDEVREWAAIPAVVTAAWLVAGMRHKLALPAAGLACAWVVAVGFLYGWGLPNVVTTAVPSCLVALLGARIAVRRWDAGTFAALAGLTASVGGGWLALAWLADAGAHRLGGPGGILLYAPHTFYEDVRFYLGWSLGLAVAPNPVAEE